MIMRMATAAAFSLLLAGAAVAQTSVPPAAPVEVAPAAPTTEPAAPMTGDTANKTKPGTPAATMAEAPATLDECIASAAELGQMAEAKTLSDSNIEKLDELFTKMETLCDAKQFTEAAAVGSDIKTVIDGQ